MFVNHSSLGMNCIPKEVHLKTKHEKKILVFASFGKSKPQRPQAFHILLPCFVGAKGQACAVHLGSSPGTVPEGIVCQRPAGGEEC